MVVEFLKKGVPLRPAWTPTKCAVRIEDLTGLAMAAKSSLEYSSAWIYSLALLVEVDPMEVKLTDRQVEVAFGLTRRYKRLAAGDAPRAEAAAVPLPPLLEEETRT